MFYMILLGIFVFIVYWYFRLDCRNIDVTYYDTCQENIPVSFHNSRFVVLADFHNNCLGIDTELLIQQIDQAHPEFVLIAGDMLVHTNPKEFRVAFELLSQLASNYKIYYGLGNHEQKIIRFEDKMDDGMNNQGFVSPNNDFKSYREKLEKKGVVFLINEQIIVEKNKFRICITGIGIDDKYFGKFKIPEIDKIYLQDLVGNSKKQCYNILIAHNPIYFKAYKSWGADLVISGHLHGGIICLPILGGVLSPQFQVFPKYYGGRFVEGNQTLIVSRGLGSHTIPLRVWNRPELVVVTLQSKQCMESDL